MTDMTLEEITKRLDELNVWELLLPYNFALKPSGTVFPYFCTILKDIGAAVRLRLLLLEGWQTMHEFVRARSDPNAGLYSTPVELPHYEVVFVKDGPPQFARYDTGYMPQPLTDSQRTFVRRLLWQVYGLALRVEADNKLPIRFADEQAVFGRSEDAEGEWTDNPFIIPPPAFVAEKIVLTKEELVPFQDLPVVADFTLDLDFGLLLGAHTPDSRPRCLYRLLVKDAKTHETLIDAHTTVQSDGGLKGLWESMPHEFLRRLAPLGRVPGEVRVRSARVFRMLRPLCVELPFKLSLHDTLPNLI